MVQNNLENQLRFLADAGVELHFVKEIGEHSLAQEGGKIKVALHKNRVLMSPANSDEGSLVLRYAQHLKDNLVSAPASFIATENCGIVDLQTSEETFGYWVYYNPFKIQNSDRELLDGNGQVFDLKDFF